MRKISDFECKVIRFSNEDVIATSVFLMDSASFNAAFGTSYTDPYVLFNGAMTDYDDEQKSWLIPTAEGVTPVENKIFITGGYFADVGITFPGTAPYAYDAHVSNGNIYTKGVTYAERNSN